MLGNIIDMHKNLKRISILFIIIVFITGVFYLQYGREIDASGSSCMNDTLSFNVTLNRLWFSSSDRNRKDIEDIILAKYKENNFHSTKFSTDLLQPKKLDISVYLKDSDILNGKPLFTFTADI